MSGEAADHASTSRAPGPDIEAEADMGRTPDTPPTEDADRLSATNSEVESAMNHRRRRAVLHDTCFSLEAFDAFNSGDAYLLCYSKWSSQSHELVCKGCTGKQI